MAGLMPTDHSVLVPVLVILSTFSTMFGVQAMVTVMSMMGDIADEHELTHGTRQEGIYFGSYNFSAKCTTALGNLVAGFTLDLISFPVNSTPGLVAEEVLFDFGTMYSSVTLITIFSTWIFWAYSLDKKKHDGIMAELQKRNTSGDHGPDELGNGVSPVVVM